MSVICAGTEYNNEFSGKGLNILLGVLVYSSAFYFFSFITADTDLWGHIKFGKDLWASKALFRHDIYSYTAYGREWINHEWLSELLMYFMYSAFGSPGLLIGKLLVGFAIVFILSRISVFRTCQPLIYGPVFVLCIFVMSPGFMIRPQILTFLFTALFLYIFHLYLERKKNLLWTLPPFMILWVNSHGGFLIGLGMFPVVVVCEFVSAYLQNRNKDHLRSLVFWMVLTEAAVLVNPYGYRLLIFLYETLSVPRNISEWEAVCIFDLSYLRFKVLAILFLFSLFFKKTERRSWELGVMLIILVYAFRHQRHTPIFAIVAAPCLAERLSMMAKGMNPYDKIKSISSLLILNLSLCILIGYHFFSTTYKYINSGFNIIVDTRKYPVYPVHFLKKNGIKGNILLPFEWGEYVIWKLYPDCRVSLDGRFRTVYPEDVINDHFIVQNDFEGWQRLLDKYPSDIILARRNSYFKQLMATGDEWVYMYSDRNSIVFVKNEDSQKDVIARLKKKKLIYPRKQLSIYFP